MHLNWVTISEQRCSEMFFAQSVSCKLHLRMQLCSNRQCGFFVQLDCKDIPHRFIALTCHCHVFSRGMGQSMLTAFARSPTVPRTSLFFQTSTVFDACRDPSLAAGVPAAPSWLL